MSQTPPSKDSSAFAPYPIEPPALEEPSPGLHEPVMPLIPYFPLTPTPTPFSSSYSFVSISSSSYELSLPIYVPAVYPDSTPRTYYPPLTTPTRHVMPPPYPVVPTAPFYQMLQCSHCGDPFGSSEALEEHLRILEKTRPFQCLEWFQQKKQLKRHADTHSEEKKFECKDCGRRFRRKDNLASHVRIHTGEKPFPCPECGKAFRHQSAFINHRRLHAAGDLPCICSTCGLSFPTRVEWASHTAEAHP